MMSFLKFGEPSDVGLAQELNSVLGKFIAIAFLAFVIAIPIAIVAIWHRTGAIWVVGYVAGIFTVPLVGIGALRAMSTLFDDNRAFIAFVAFGFAAITFSLAAATYAFLQ